MEKGWLWGHGEMTPEMKRIDSEMSRRTAEKWEKDPIRNTDQTSVGLMQTDGTRIEHFQFIVGKQGQLSRSTVKMNGACSAAADIPVHLCF